MKNKETSCRPARRSGIALALVLVGVLLCGRTDASTTITGPGSNNGDFNDDVSAVDSRSFGSTPFWYNLGTGDQNAECTRTNLPYDGTRHATLYSAAVRRHSQNTGYDIQLDDTFSVSYVWLDGVDWEDAQDQVEVRLFMTDSDTIGGTPTDLATFTSGISATGDTWEAKSGLSAPAGAAYDGKRLFVALDIVDGNGDADDFCRIDNFTLVVNPDPIPTLSEWGMIILACLVVLAGGRKLLRRRTATHA